MKTSQIPQPKPHELGKLLNLFSQKENGCWDWSGTIASGYGKIMIRGKNYRAHRVSMQWVGGMRIPIGKVIDHICKNKRCVNPDHMEIVTQKINVFRCEKGAMHTHRSKTHCPNGHPYNKENTYKNNGGRSCRMCRRFPFRKGVRKPAPKVRSTPAERCTAAWLAWKEEK